MSIGTCAVDRDSGSPTINAQLAPVIQQRRQRQYAGLRRGRNQANQLTELPAGVRSRGRRRVPAIDHGLQQAVFSQNDTVVATLTTTSNGAAGDRCRARTPGQGNDLGSLLGACRVGFSALLNDPSNPTAAERRGAGAGRWPAASTA